MKADDFGRFNAGPKLLRSLLFPILDGVRDSDITRWLAECETAGLLVVYTSSDAKPLLQITKFGQRTRAERSKFEGPPTNGSHPTASRGQPPTIVSKCPPMSYSGFVDANSESESNVGVSPPSVEMPARNASKFVTPTVAEVKLYCLERKNSVDAEKFVDFYQSKGWKVGKEPMRDWKASVRTWEKGKQNGTTSGPGQRFIPGIELGEM
jgi:hypothetical protein